MHIPATSLATRPDVTDLNADGLADLVIGAQNYDGPAGRPTNAGGVFLYYGRAPATRAASTSRRSAAPTRRTASRRVGAKAGDRLGIWVSAGDLDGDGTRDLVLGADQADGPNGDRPDAGAIYVIFGSQPLPAVIDLANAGGPASA